MNTETQKAKVHIALYCHFLFGLGHISRTAAIANAIVGHYPGSACTIFTDQMRDVDFFIHPDVDIIELPRVSTPTTEINEEITQRSDKITSFLEKTSVSVFLTDHLPFGVYGELIKVLRQNIIRNWGIQFVLGLPYPQTEEIIPKDPYLKKLYQAYANVFLYTDKDWYDFPLDPTADHLIKYHTGLITRRVDYSPRLTKQQCIVGTTGSGVVGLDLFKKVLAATEEVRNHGVILKWIIGPMGDPLQYNKACDGEMNIVLVESSTIDEMVQEGTMMISQVGYNTAFALVQTPLPIVFVPYVGIDSEQGVRAEQLAASVENVWSIPEDDPEFGLKLKDIVRKGLKTPPAKRVLPFMVDGAGNAASRLLSMAKTRKRFFRPSSSKKILTIHADDLGMTHGVTQGITEAISSGVVTDTSVMACVPFAKERVLVVKNKLIDRIGLHLQLTEGTPCLEPHQVPSLVYKDGKFPSKMKYLSKNINPLEVKKEWESQIQRVLDWGINPTYLDSHHNAHLIPILLPVVVGLAQEYQLPIRSDETRLVHHYFKSLGVRSIELTVTQWYGDNLSKEYLLELIDSAFNKLRGRGSLELVCHPGYSDPTLERLSKHNIQRERELKIFTDDELPQLLKTRGISLLSTHQIFQ